MYKDLLLRDDIEYEDIQTFDWGEVAWIHQPDYSGNQRMSIGLVTIFSNSRHERHFHFGEEQVLFVLEGSGIQVIDGKENLIKSGMIMHCPPYSEHEIINNSSENMKLIIIYTPAQFGEVDQGLFTIDQVKILENIDKDVLEGIQEEVSEFLNLSIVFLDSQKRRITNQSNINEFCRLCLSKKECDEETNRELSSPLMNMHRVHMCKFNILTISAPIIIDNTTVGYIKCGHLLIKKPKNIKKKIEEISKEFELDYKEILNYYNSIPLVPKSRLYALGEYLTIIAKYVSRIIVNNIIEKEIIEKNNQIIEKTKKTLHLENALKEANVKLLKSKVSSNLKNINFDKKNVLKVDNTEYPLEKEIELNNSITELNKKLAYDLITDLINEYKLKKVSINKFKNTIDELFNIIPRIVYNEVKDIDIARSLRNAYKKGIYNCITYDDLLQFTLEFIKKIIDILEYQLFKGEDEFIKKVNMYINKNYNKDLTLKSIANIFYISPNYLSSIFNEQNKTSLTDYINKIRVYNAKKYLIQTNMKISIIARKVGYNNISYFSSIFKKIEKCTPKEYRVTKGH